MHTLLDLLASIMTAIAAAIASMVSSAAVVDQPAAAAAPPAPLQAFHATMEPTELRGKLAAGHPDAQRVFEIRAERLCDQPAEPATIRPAHPGRQGELRRTFRGDVWPGRAVTVVFASTGLNRHGQGLQGIRMHVPAPAEGADAAVLPSVRG